jgi:hypothetical protein
MRSVNDDMFMAASFFKITSYTSGSKSIHARKH